MNKKQYILVSLLILGLVFSSMIRICFNLSDGFEFHSFWIKILPTPIFDYAGFGSPQLQLTSTLVGYLFFLIFGFLYLNDLKSNVRSMFILIGFIILVAYAFYFESSSFVQDYNLKFIGQHLRVGPALFALGLIIFMKDYRIKKQRITN